MLGNLPDAHELTLDEIDAFIDLALDTRDKKMFKEYLSLKESMIAERTKSVWVMTYSDKAEKFISHDEVDRINKLTKEDILALMNLAVDLNDRKMFNEYAELLREMKGKEIYVATYSDPHYTPRKIRMED